MKRYFEFVDAKSSKFWEVWIEGTTVFTRFGKIGVNGQTTIKEFPDLSSAEKARGKAIDKKTKSGYVEGTSVEIQEPIATAQLATYEIIQAVMESEVDSDRKTPYERALNALPPELQLVFRSEAPAPLDHLSAQSLFLISYMFVREYSGDGFSTPEIGIPGDLRESDSLGNPEEWDCVWWSLDFDYSLEDKHELTELGPDDFIPFINGEAFPQIDIEFNEFDEDEEVTYFRAYIPVSNDDEELLARIKDRPSLKTALIESAEMLEDDWAAVRASLCLRGVE